MPSDYIAIQKDNVRRRGEEFDDIGQLISKQLYSDKTHFVFELLQNAEDALERRCKHGAKDDYHRKVRFFLHRDRLEFRHYGAAFTEDDVKGISDVLKGTKKEDREQIGIFGIGFKSVYAFTASPEVHSCEEHFVIKRYIRPEAKEPEVEIDENETVFILPFDRKDLSANEAFRLIQNKLRGLGPDILLFLTYIDEIEWKIEGEEESRKYLKEYKEIDGIPSANFKGNQIAIKVQHPGESKPKTVRFLRFDKEVEVNTEEGEKKSCRISVAYSLEQVKEQADENVEKNNTGKLRGKKGKESAVPWRIKPLDRGLVSIYFTADKEASNLRFHLHAPFASTASRDSVCDCDANNKLRDHLAQLIVESMTAIRDQGLLTVDFLAVLPNDKDNLPSFYHPIQENLVMAFKNESLTPMKRGGHAAASGIFRGQRVLSDLIDDDDLVILLGNDYFAPLWVANPPQRNQREDNFLLNLEIEEWTDSDLVLALILMGNEARVNWMHGKDETWHQKLYAYLEEYADALEGEKIIRISDGTYRRGSECFFPTREVEHDETFPRVAKGAYISGKEENKKARDFLEGVGVRDVDEIVEIENILKTYYKENSVRLNRKEHYSHLRRFMQFLESRPHQYNLFENAHIFLVDDSEGIKWMKPEMVYLDEPYLKTRLRVYYDQLVTSGRKFPLSKVYQKSGIKPEEIVKFAKRLHASVILDKNDVTAVISRMNENIRSKLCLDWSWLLWNSLAELGRKECNILLRSETYHKGWGHYGTRYYYSSLCMKLRNTKWVPQMIGREIELVQPCEAIAEKLPEGFMYQTGWRWLQDLEFGKNINERLEAQRKAREQQTAEYKRKQQIAKDFGFESPEEAEEIACLKNKYPEEFIQWKKEVSTPKKHPTFPSRPVKSQERRREHLEEQLSDAVNKRYDKRGRTVRTTRGTVEPSQWLKANYTNDDKKMVCQICKEEMPFKKPDGEYYFEAVEAFSKDMLEKEHEAQYLALCPVCAARYKVFIKENENAVVELKEVLLAATEAMEIPLVLGELTTSIQFVETHLHDIKVILENTI